MIEFYGCKDFLEVLSKRRPDFPQVARIHSGLASAAALAGCAPDNDEDVAP